LVKHFKITGEAFNKRMKSSKSNVALTHLLPN